MRLTDEQIAELKMLYSRADDKITTTDWEFDGESSVEVEVVDMFAAAFYQAAREMVPALIEEVLEARNLAQERHAMKRMQEVDRVWRLFGLRPEGPGALADCYTLDFASYEAKVIGLRLPWLPNWEDFDFGGIGEGML